jgi:hypothetical protein
MHGIPEKSWLVDADEAELAKAGLQSSHKNKT